MAAMSMAFLVNLCAFPLVSGLMPYIAREVYHTDRTGLAYLVASFASGALLGSLTMARVSGSVPPARTMLVFCALWYVMICIFARMPTHSAACMALFVTGLVQSVGMVSMSTLILRSTDAAFRGRVMGFRMLAIYGVPIGLLISGPLITNFGYPLTATLYCTFGIAVTASIAIRWRKDVWRRDAPANVH
jgi:predicted MFS family arabinose efflux permease